MDSKVLNMEPVPVNAVEHFPDWLNDLNGKRIRIRGFMYPTFIQDGIERFLLARDNDICCFGRDPKIYDIIAVSLEAGDTASYIEGRPFDVVGQLRIEPDSSGDTLDRLYWIDDAKIIDR